MSTAYNTLTLAGLSCNQYPAQASLAAATTAANMSISTRSYHPNSAQEKLHRAPRLASAQDIITTYLETKAGLFASADTLLQTLSTLIQ